MKSWWCFFLATVAATSHAQGGVDENNLVASSPFQLYLDPTFVQLNLESQAIASNAISEILSFAASNELHHVSVVIQDVSFVPHGRRHHRRLNQNMPLQLPSTTLTFAVLAHFSGSTLTRDYLNQLVRNVLTSNAGQAELLSQLKSHHAHFEDLRLVQVTPVISTSPTPTATDNKSGFIETLTFVDIVLLLVSIVVLIVVSVLIVGSIRSNRRDHEGVLQMLQRERQHMAASQQANQEESSISSRLYLLKSSMQNKSKMDNTNLHVAESIDETPEATEDEEEEATDTEQEPESSDEQQPVSLEAHMVVMERASVSAVDHHSAAEPTQNSPSSYHSAQELLASSSSDEQSESSHSSSMRSGGVISDFDVILTPPSKDEASESDAQTSGTTGSAGGHSSGMSSAHFSSSRFFQSRTNGMSMAPSEDTFDVFAVDVHKYEESILELGNNDDNGSKMSATSSFLEEWVKQIRVITSERSSVATPDDSASTPECVSVPSFGDLPHEETLKVLDKATTHLQGPASVVEENNQ